MHIRTYYNGYVLTVGDKQHTFKGRGLKTIEELTEKVKEILNEASQECIENFLRGDVNPTAENLGVKRKE